MPKRNFKKLIEYLVRIPAIKEGIGSGQFDNGLWWVKFKIDIGHPVAWQVVQKLANVVNYLSINERLPTTFYPVSPPSYLNGGPQEFLSWVIESTVIDFTPNDLQEWLDGRLPRPIDDLNEWKMEDDSDK
jgi:hypothetical protein